MALLVRNGGSRHTGQAAPPQRNIQYKGIGQIARWFEDWNSKGTVLQWDIKRVITSGNTAVVEWYFKCDYAGNEDGLDGVTIAELDADIKICGLKEFRSKAEHYCPYDS